MASVDLSELIPDLEAALTIPGQTSPYAAASEDEWIARMRNAFWSAVLDGLIIGYTINEDGVITEVGGTTALGREYQQIVILYAAMNVIQNQLLQLKTSFKAKAGPVEYETQQSAGVLKNLLDMLMAQRDMILKRLSDGGAVSAVYIDAVQSRDARIYDGTIYWIGG